MTSDRTQLTVGEILWTPTPERIADANITAFVQWLKRERNVNLSSDDNYLELWQWSIDHLEDFWQAIWDYFKVQSSAPYECVLRERVMPGAQWFPGARLNYAEHVLRGEVVGKEALLYISETVPLKSMSWSEFAGQVRILATELRNLGVKPGDRVVAYMPNIPQTMVAMLATTSIGAIWASCGPDFGIRGALDRYQQLEPKVIFCVDGYQYKGKPFSRKTELKEILEQLPTLQKVVYLPYLNPADRSLPHPKAILWADLVSKPAVPASEFKFEQVPFDHPIWILFSSGTTGLPKPIVHSHGGTILEQMKSTHLHMDIHPGDKMFFYTTTGWMMWNFLSSSILVGAVPVLYDGDPSYPGPEILWKIFQDAGVSFVGASPTYQQNLEKTGVVPKKSFDLSKLKTVMLAGSPVTAECMAWFYENVKSDLYIMSGSGGTDICTGFNGAIPTHPVRAGEIQGPCLAVAAFAFNERGEKIVDEVGELVVTHPMPSMPIGFWNDTNNERYMETYFQEYPGIWRHGDFYKVNARGGCFVLGRSDATLNRHGIRIGTAEIYRSLQTVTEVDDSLIVNLDLPGGTFFMPLFVKLKRGLTLNADIENKIKKRIREEYTPRHVPDKIYQVPDIPYTLTGKKMEVPVRRIMMGVPVAKAANISAMADPGALDYFVDYAQNQKDYKL
jgi:acetoacetyl-CoA synthetase